MSQKNKSIIAAFVFLGLIALWAGWRHGKTEADDSDSRAAGPAVVTAAVTRVQRGAIAQSLTIAGAFKPFQEIDVHAKVAGYIKTIYVDVGTHVKEEAKTHLDSPCTAALTALRGLAAVDHGRCHSSGDGGVMVKPEQVFSSPD